MTDPYVEDKIERERRHIRLTERCAVLCARDFADEDGDEPPQPMASLNGQASRDISELARQIHVCCSGDSWTSFQKRVACEQLLELAIIATQSIDNLARQFPEPFHEIAEELPAFPCLFPAHAEDLASLQERMWKRFKLGQRYALKLRGANGRKTFSRNTETNSLLLELIRLVHEFAHEEAERAPDQKYCSTIREVAQYVPLSVGNAKKWLEAIWDVLLILHPEPEKVPLLRQLVTRPSLKKKRIRRDGTVGEKTFAHNTRASIKSKLGTYLRRMLNDSPDLQIEP